MSYEQAAHLAQWVEEIKDARDVLSAIDVTSAQRRTLKRCVDEALDRAVVELGVQEDTANSGKPWSKEDVALLTTTLGSLPDADSYGSASQALLMVAKRLRRAPDSIKRKITEHGLSKKVDYWLARGE